MSFPIPIEPDEKQTFQCMHCKTLFVAGPNEYEIVGPKNLPEYLKEVPERYEQFKHYWGIATFCPTCKKLIFGDTYK